MPTALPMALTFDARTRASIIACMNAALENARQCAEQISSEMWEELNQLFLQTKTAPAESGKRRPIFLSQASGGCTSLSGHTDRRSATAKAGTSFKPDASSSELPLRGLLEAHVGELFEPPILKQERSDYLDMWVC